ncbi:hypothetical protein J3Q64DRAFT_1675869 [Phycomyces blakesleeanus]
MLAWCQTQLRNYVELSLLRPLTDLYESWQDGKVFLCIAHRFFPESVPDLVSMLQNNNPQSNQQLAFSLFADRLQMSPPTEPITEQIVLDYLTSLRDALDHTSRPVKLIPSDRATDQADLLRTSFEHRASLVLWRINAVPQAHTDDIGTYEGQLESFETSLAQLETEDLVSFHAAADKLPHHTRQLPEVEARVSAVETSYRALQLQLEKGSDDLDKFKSSLAFGKIITPIRNELEFIQAKMLKPTTTDSGIQDLEERTRSTGVAIERVETQYGDLLHDGGDGKNTYRLLLDALVQKHHLVSRWISEIRVWYVEAERIRHYIEERIEILEQQPLLDGLQHVELEQTSDEIAALNADQDQLKAQVDIFNQNDMTRLKEHVMALTGTDRTEELSPADTTTIEITFTTLTTLDRLKHLLRRRAYELQILTLRMVWEQHYGHAITWVRTADNDIKLFVSERARWQPPPHVIVKEEIIAELLGLETRVNDFDQGEFSVTVNAYQDLDDSSNVELPVHLESRQVALEEAFEQVTLRVGFARQVVEQCLNITDFLYKADELKTTGEVLRQAIVRAEREIKPGDTDTQWREQVLVFQEQALALVTGVAARIPYPEATHPSDQEQTFDANNSIRSMVGARKASLFLFGEALDQALASYRRVLQLQKRARQLTDEVNRLQGWVDERTRNVARARIDVFVGKCALDLTDLGRLEKERDGQRAKVKAIQGNDLRKLSDHLASLESAADVAETPVTLTTAMAAIRQGILRTADGIRHLETLLDHHSIDLEVLGMRIGWETQATKVTHAISSMTLKTWDFVVQQAQWRPADTSGNVGQESSSHLASPNLDEFEAMEARRHEFEDKQLVSLDTSFQALVKGFQRSLGHAEEESGDETQKERRKSTPTLVQQRQQRLVDNATHLAQTADFAREVLDQNTALRAYDTLANSHLTDGLGLLGDIQNALDTLEAAEGVLFPVDRFEARLKQFDQDVFRIWKHQGSAIPYPLCPEGARANRSSTQDDNISADINAFVLRLYDELLQLGKKIRALLDAYGVAVHLKQEIDQCFKNTTQVLEQIIAAQTSLQAKKLDPAMSLTELPPVDTRNQIKTSSIKSTEDGQTLSTTLKELQDELAHLLAYAAETNCTVNAIHVTNTQTEARAQADQLILSSETHDLRVNAYLARLTWEDGWRECQSTTKKLQTITRTLQDKAIQSIATSTYNDSLQPTIQQAVSDAKRLMTKDMAAATEALTQAEAAFELTQVEIPSDCAERHQDLERAIARLDETLDILQIQINFLVDRFAWESRANEQQNKWTVHQDGVETYIQKRARWHSEDSSEGCKDSLVKLEEKAEDADEEEKESKFLDKGVYQIAQKIQESRDTAVSQLKYAREVLNQQIGIRGCLDEVMELDQLAETIKTTLLSADVLDAHETHEACLRDYDNRVAVLRDRAQTRIDYPIRETKTQILEDADTKANTQIREHTNARIARLGETSNSLLAILRSRERLSRRNAALEAYLADATVVREWISGQHERTKEAHTGSDTRTSVEVLRDTVEKLGAVSAAVKGYTGIYGSLRDSAASHATTIRQEIDQQIENSQKSIDASWTDLVDETESLLNESSTALRLAEFRLLVSNADAQMEEYDVLASDADVSSVTEETVAMWLSNVQTTMVQPKIDQVRICSLKEGTGIHATVMREELDRLVSVQNKLVEALQTLAKQVAHHRLRQDYSSAAKNLELFVDEKCKKLEECRTTFGVLLGEPDQDTLYCRSMASVYSSVSEEIDDHKNELEKVQSQYRFLQFQNVEAMETIDSRNAALESGWKALQKALLETKQLADQGLQWRDFYVTLLQTDSQLDAFEASLTTVLDETTALANIGRQIKRTGAVFPGLIKSIQNVPDLASPGTTKDNKSWLEDRLKTVQKHYEDLQSTVDQRHKLAQKQEAYDECVALANAIKEEADEESNAIIQRMTNVASNDMFGEDGSSLERFYCVYQASLATSESVLERLTHQTTKRLKGNTRTLLAYEIDPSVVQELESSTHLALERLETELKRERLLGEPVKRCLSHAKSAESIGSWITNCQTALNKLLADPAMIDEQNGPPAAEEIEQKMVLFHKIIVSFEDMTNSILNSTNKENVFLQQAVKSRAEAVKTGWEETSVLLDEFKQAIVKASQGVAVARKIKTMMMILGEAREHLANLQITEEADPATDRDEDTTSVLSTASVTTMLREQEVVEMERELDSLESEAKIQFKQETQALDVLLEQCGGNKTTFVQQRTEVDMAVESVLGAMDHKRQEISKARVVGKYLSATDELEVVLSALEEAVAKAAPHRATMIGSSFSRADLQAKLIELDARYKYYEGKVTEGLETAKTTLVSMTSDNAAAKKQLQPHLRKLRARWTTVNSQVKTRRLELTKTMEGAVDPDQPLYRQVRNRKSSLPTRKAASVLREREVGYMNPSTTTGRYFGTTTPDRHNYQPSKSASLSMRTPAIRVTQTPPNSYVADPDNDLDMEIGRIINETPYRVKVKMVPGEVGRYWFGEGNAKMAYCRVLKSKMVMVRVGGGWTELSQFLRDHCLLEGEFIPKNRMTIAEDDMEQASLPSIQEGFIETRRAKSPSGRPLPRGSISGRSLSPTPPPVHPSRSTSGQTGYIDGDKYIAVDRHGNQLEVRMTRAASKETNGDRPTRRRVMTRKRDPQESVSTATSSTSTSTATGSGSGSGSNGVTSASTSTPHGATIVVPTASAV